MSAAGWLDIGVIILALLAASSGWRQGAVASALAFLGVVLGAVAGILIAPHVLVHVGEGKGRVFAGVLLIVVLVVVGEVAGMVLGRAARGSMSNPAARIIDSSIGGALQFVAVLVAAWLLALPLARSAQPGIAAAVRDSTVLGKVNEFAPEWVRALPHEFSALLDTSGLPAVMGPFGRTPIASVDPPDPSVEASPVAKALQRQVFRINGEAPSCGRKLEGSGFVVAPERVMTNAHVVAGTSNVTVDVPGRTLPAKVVLYDSNTDVAVLAVPGLGEAPLPLAPQPAKSGTSAIVLGYPGGGSYKASPARVRETLQLPGPNIYDSANVRREVYTVRGSVQQGNSGGPLVDDQGRLLGVVFGAAVDNSETGFVLTLNEVRKQIAAAAGARTPVGTQRCV